MPEAGYFDMGKWEAEAVHTMAEEVWLKLYLRVAERDAASLDNSACAW